MNNAIFVIKPFKWHGIWVFDDERVGLDKEPFVAGADTMIDTAVRLKGIPNADDGFLMLFSAQPFPDTDFELEWLRSDGDGNVYQGRFDIEGQIQEMEGWLCPALNLYYPEAPKKLYVQVRETERCAVNDFDELLKSSPSRDPIEPTGDLLQYLKGQAALLRAKHSSKYRGNSDQPAVDRENAVKHMYDTRREFVEDANRSYTRYLVALAAILYAFKYAVDADDGERRAVMFFATGTLCILVAGFVWACKRLLQSNYYLYSASVITAAIKSLATQEWSHVWFDSVHDVASRGAKNKWHWYHKLGFGIRPPRPERWSAREALSKEWGSNPLSLIGINSVVHDVLIVVLLSSAIVGFYWGAKANLRHEADQYNRVSKEMVEDSGSFYQRVARIDVLLRDFATSHSELLQSIRELSTGTQDPIDN